MRMRKKKHGEERLLACASVMKSKPETPITSSVEDFGCETPLALEIGCGKGGFACGMATLHPEVSFYAMEKVENVMVVAAEKAVASAGDRSRDNLRMAIGDATLIREWFAENSLDTIYLNFSDPWPKKGYAKRRLTNRKFLFSYYRILKEGGKICLKTDNAGLFDYTLDECADLGIIPDFVTHDFHNSEYSEGNVMTEYEKNFSDKGMPIHALRITVNKEILRKEPVPVKESIPENDIR